MKKTAHWISVVFLLISMALMFLCPFSPTSFFAGFLMAAFAILRIFISAMVDEDDDQPNPPATT